MCDSSLSHISSFKYNLSKKIKEAIFLKLKRKENTLPLQEIHYHKTKEEYEVDFLIKEGSVIKELIQVNYDVSDEETLRREVHALLYTKEDINLSHDVPLTVIT